MSEITKTDASGLPSWIWLVFAALVVLVYFSGLAVPFMGPDEPRYAEVGLEMFTSGDWLTPTLGTHPWFEKPPLLYWLELASFNIFGISEFAARLGPTLCGLGTIAVLSVLGRAEGGGPKTDRAALMALIAASTLGVIVFSHAAGFDIVVTFALTAALTSFFIYDRSQKRSLLLLFYVFVGIAILAKGLIGIIFPFAIVCVYYLLSRRKPARGFLLSLFWGLPVILIIAAPWHIAMYRRYGSEFIDVYFIQHHLERFTTNKYLHPQPFYFFFWVLPAMTLPWMPVFLVAIWRSARELILRAMTPLVSFAVSWLVVPVAFFSFSGSKLPGYIAPALPAAVILTGLLVHEAGLNKRKWRTAVVAIAASTLIITEILLTSALPAFAERNSVKALIEAGNQKGYGSSRVLTLHTISYNAEYYAAGRLLRDETGVQRKLEGVQLVLDEISKERGQTILVLVPVEFVSQLTEYDKVTAEVIKDNGEIAIVAVSEK